MPPAPRYRLKLKSLQFCSVVDQPAQEPAKCLLIKRAGNEHDISAFAQFVKADDALGLAFFWAFKSTDENGDAYHDLQGDQVIADDDMVKAAMAFMEQGGAVDQQHDESTIGKTVFCMPMNAEIAKAYGIPTKQSGLMVALKPSAEVLTKLKSGEYTGVSIQGTGVREIVADKRRGYDPEQRSALCKAQWSTAYIDNLPDSSFLYVEGGGKKDADGKTTPRDLRHFPYKDSGGSVDIAHLRDAIGRIPQSSLAGDLKDRLQVRAEKLLAAQHAKKRALLAVVRKQVVLTDEVDGHQHGLDLDDPADYCGDRLSTTYATSEGADCSHAHVWTFDPTSGAVTIAADSGHTHTVDGVVPPEVLAAFKLDEQAEEARNAQRLLERVLDGESGASAVNVTIASRAPQAKSTPASAVRTVKSQPEETMPDIIVLTETQKAHYDKLSGKTAEAFLAKSAAERDAEIAKAIEADPIVFKGETTGIEVRKSQGEFAKKLAEQNEAMAKTQAAQATELAKARADRETEILKARAGKDLAHLAKSLDVKVAVLKAIDGIADEKIRGEALEMLKGADARMAEAGVAKGYNPGGDPELRDDELPTAKLEKRVREFQAEHKLPTYEQAFAKALQIDPQARDLYAALS